jgi:hypothetical protein
VSRISIRELDPATLAVRLRSSIEGRAFAANHPNVVVRGMPEEADRILEILLPLCRRPVQAWPRHAPPPAAPDGGTFLVRDLQALSLHEQRNLLAWLNERLARVQMVGVTQSALFPLVDGAGFLDALYYRLNTLYIDADDVW